MIPVGCPAEVTKSVASSERFRASMSEAVDMMALGPHKIARG